MKNRISIFLILSLVLFLVIGTGLVSATDCNDTKGVFEDNEKVLDNSQEIVPEDYSANTQETADFDEKDNDFIRKNKIQSKKKKKKPNITGSVYDSIDAQMIVSEEVLSNYTITLNTTINNETIDLVYDVGKETAITRNISVNGLPDVTKLGADYAYADENAVYTITSAEILRVAALDSYCQQLYGYVPKYTFFREIGSNVKYIISREKWNVIMRSLNGYHVNWGYSSVNPPYAVTVNLSGKIRYYPVYYDAQEWINGHQYTCGPTAMSMISQALNCYSSERKLSGIYMTTARDGTEESDIISFSPGVHMKLTNIANTQISVISALQAGKMIFWHIRGHYMCVVAYNSVNSKFLCLNPSGPSHNIAAVQWATWTEMMNTDRPLKENGFMAVTPYWTLTSSDITHAQCYYFNMGGKYTAPANAENPKTGYDNKVSFTVSTPSVIPDTTTAAVLKIDMEIRNDTGLVSDGQAIIYWNNREIRTVAVSGGRVSLRYILPAYVRGNILVTAKYINAFNGTVGDVKNTVNKNLFGKTLTNTTAVKSKKMVNIVISPIKSRIGEEVELKAVLRDFNGNLIDGGNLVFKINGVSLKSDYTFNSNANVIKFHVTNGTVSTTIVADKMLRDAKNVSVSYSGTSTYQECKASQSAEIGLRYAQITVTAAPAIQKQYETITFRTQIRDVTYNNRSDSLLENVNDYVYFKINNVTLKEGGEQVKVNVVKGVAEYRYKVPQGMAGITSGNILRNYTVTAGFIGPDYYPTAKNTTSFNVERSNITLKISSAVYNTKSNHLKINATIKDYGNNYLMGNNKVNIKVNGKTLKQGDKSIIFTVKNGLMSLDIALPDTIRVVKNVEIVTGERTAYLGGRVSTSAISKE